MGKPNMYIRALWLVTDLAIWKKRVKRVALFDLMFIVLFAYSFFVAMGKDENRPWLIGISLLFVAACTVLLWLLIVNKPTEERYGIDH